MSDPYASFLVVKAPSDQPSGLRAVPALPAALKPFQRAITEWALRRGRAAMFEGTGLGKTLQQLAWARTVADHENARVLILTPLAVAEQTVAEAAKFGIASVAYAADPDHATTDIVVTNYERFEKFDISHYAGIVLDESGIIKSQDGKTRALLTEACRDVPWRLCCTATPAPNDYTELGQHAEFLGVMTAKEMLSMFFVHDGSIRADDHSQGIDGWRLKRHAERDFWRWLASWSVMVRHPKDLGFDDPSYDLPPLNLHQITVAAEYKPVAGSLFPQAASTLAERIGVRKDTVEDRVLAAVEIVGQSPFGNVLSEPCSQTKPKSGAALKPASDTPTIQSERPQSKPPRSNPGSQTPGELTSEPITSPIKTNLDPEPESSETDTTLPGGTDTQPTLNTETFSSGEPERFQAGLRLSIGEDGSSKNTASRSSNTTQCSPSKGAGAPSVIGAMETAAVGGSTLTTAMQRASSGVCSAPTATSPSASFGTTETFCTELSNTSASPPERWIIWCKLNKEQDRLESTLKNSCFSVYGSLPAEEKVSRLQRWLAGERPVLLSKPRICGYGLNLQSCKNVIFVGASDSFEETYQAIRRCWRFGQARPVDVYFIASELEGAVVANLRRKEAAFDAMLDAMSVHMRDLMAENVIGGRNATTDYNPQTPMQVPEWLLTA